MPSNAELADKVAKLRDCLDNALSRIEQQESRIAFLEEKLLSKSDIDDAKFEIIEEVRKLADVQVHEREVQRTVTHDVTSETLPLPDGFTLARGTIPPLCESICVSDSFLKRLPRKRFLGMGYHEFVYVATATEAMDIVDDWPLHLPRVKFVMISLGGNDVANGTDPEAVVAAVATFADEVRKRAPGARVVVVGLPPRRGSTLGSITNVNNGFQSIPDVVFLDLGVNISSLPDGVHPPPGNVPANQALLDRLGDVVRGVRFKFKFSPPFRSVPVPHVLPPANPANPMNQWFANNWPPAIAQQTRQPPPR